MSKKTKDKFRKTIAMLLTLSIMWTSFHLQMIQVHAENSAGILYEYEGYQVQYVVINAWEGGHQVEVTIRNMGTEIIRDWEMMFDTQGKITNLWNAVIQTEADKKYFVKNEVYNAEIPVDGSVCFGYTVVGDSLEAPKEFVLAKRKKQVVKQIDIKQKVVNDWGSGAQVEIEIMNPSDRPLKNWELIVESNVEITNLWNAEWIRRESDNRYIISALSWNHTIPAGGCVNVGLTGIKNENQEVVFNIIETTEMVTYFESEEATPGNATSGNATDPDIDTDGDTLPDYLEKEYGCDVNNPDTDGDGLSDGYEIYILGTNPLLSDSDENGITDDLEDFDEDQLNNLEEYYADTDPFLDDSDFDELGDYEELKIYGTNPNNPDTDGDFVADSDEILIGLDPNNPETFGVPDGQYKFEQKVSGNSWMMAGINAEDAPYHLSVSMNAAGVAENNLSAQVSGYSQVMSNDAVIGEVAELFYKDGLECEEITIEFHLNDDTKAMLSEMDMDMPEEFQGIHRLNVFKYDETLNMLLPMETYFDENQEMVYVKDAKLGSYCLMDMAAWFESLGYDFYGDSEEMATFSLRSLKEEDTDETYGENVKLSKQAILGQKCQEDGAELSVESLIMDEEWVLEDELVPAMFALGGEYLTNPNFYCDKYDMIITIQGIGTEKQAYLLELESYKEMANRLFQKMPELRIKYIISTTPTRIEEFATSDWITNAKENAEWLDSKKDLYSSEEYGRYGDYDGGLSCAFDYAIQKVQCRDDAKRAVFWTWNSEYTFNEHYLYYTPELAVGLPNTSVFIMANYMYLVNQENWGIVCAEVETSDSATAFSPLDVLDRDARVIGGRLYYWFINKCEKSISDGVAVISATGLKALPKWYRYISYLDELEYIDTDGDLLTDFEEIDLSHPLMKYDSECERYIFPTLGEYLKAGGAYVEHALDRYSTYAQMRYLKENVCVVPLRSDPTMIDSDLDGILDNVYSNPKAAGKEILDWVKESEEYFNFSDDEPLKAAAVFEWPVYNGGKPECRLVSGFTEYRSKMTKFHHAIDVASACGAEVRSSYSGRVVYATPMSSWCYHCSGPCGCDHGFGNYICIEINVEGKKYYVQYSHLSKILVCEGEFVLKGAKIGEVGNSGWAFGYHLDYLIYDNEQFLYYEPYDKKVYIDPIFFDFIEYVKEYPQKEGYDTIPWMGYYMRVPDYLENTCSSTEDEAGKNVHCYECDDYLQKIIERYGILQKKN